MSGASCITPRAAGTPRRWSWRRRLASALCVALVASAASPAQAHTTSEAYLSLATQDGSAIVTGRIDIALRDLDEVLSLDSNGDGELTWGELRASRDAVAAYAAARVILQADGQACAPRPGELLFIEYAGGGYAALGLAFHCAAPARVLTLDYGLFADANPLHRGLLKLGAGELTRSAVLNPMAKEPQRFELAESGLWQTFATYVGQGVWHIWIGIDHILFLLALLLPAVLWREATHWVPAATFRAAFIDVLKIVTAFTLAHSITLTAATLGWLTLPSRPVEAVIAASVALAAANNVWPLVGGRRWVVAFVFGLVHGFGFAGALAELGLPQGALALALFGFNIGVELGQLAIVAVFLPIAFSLRSTRLYRQGALVGGSAVIVVVALWWFAERAFGLELGWHELALQSGR